MTAHTYRQEPGKREPKAITVPVITRLAKSDYDRLVAVATKRQAPIAAVLRAAALRYLRGKP